MIRTLAFGGYRSLRDLCLAVGRLMEITEGNAAGNNELDWAPEQYQAA